MQEAIDKAVNEDLIMNQSLLFKHDCGLQFQFMKTSIKIRNEKNGPI